MEEEARLGGSGEGSGHEPAGADSFPRGTGGRRGAFREDWALGWEKGAPTGGEQEGRLAEMGTPTFIESEQMGGVLQRPQPPLPCGSREASPSAGPKCSGSRLASVEG